MLHKSQRRKTNQPGVTSQSGTQQVPLLLHKGFMALCTNPRNDKRDLSKNSQCCKNLPCLVLDRQLLLPPFRAQNILTKNRWEIQLNPEKSPLSGDHCPPHCDIGGSAVSFKHLELVTPEWSPRNHS